MVARQRFLQLKYFSDEIKLLFFPFRASELMLKRREHRAGWALGMYVFVLASFVALTTERSFHLFHMINTAIFWMFVPLNQWLALSGVMALFTPNSRFSPKTKLGLPSGQVLETFFKGQLSWYLFFLWLAAVSIHSSEVVSLFAIFSVKYLVFAFLFVVLGWSLLVNWALFFQLFQGPRKVAAFFTYYMLLIGLYVIFFSLTNQLQPLLQ